MTKKTTLLILFIIVAIFNGISQNSKKEVAPNSSVTVIEKAYLHTDRTFYNLGETIWYKAYLVHAYNHILTNNSNLLYVELISPDSKIISRNTTKLQYGLGNGDFTLSDSLSLNPGTYQLRAYTNWMRNFNDNFIFKKEIEIIDINAKNTNLIANNSNKNAKNTSTYKQIAPIDSLKIEFFPEGGSLIEGIPCLVAFKASDTYGNPVNVEGNIIDSNGNLISEVKSQHDGLGKFILTASNNENYIGSFTNFNQEKIEFAIPDALKTGFALNLNKLKQKNVLIINTNPETLGKIPSQKLYLNISSRGITYVESEISINKTSTSILIPTEKLPEGIARITLYDETGLPHCERLMYVEKDPQAEIKITSNKPEYTSKEKVNLRIHTTSQTNQPIIANFSITATDSNTQIPSVKDSNICSYFLLESDIRGKIYNPTYYFNNENANRFYNLDLLLLTQGWRDFLWKKNITLNSTATHRAQKGINISGRVKKLFSSEGKEDSKVILYFSNKGNVTTEVNTTKEDGTFLFENLSFSGPTDILLNVKNKNNKDSGMIVLDSIFGNPLLADFKNSGLNENATTLIKENIQKKYVDFDVPMSNRLNEILIIGKNKSTSEEKYGFANHTYEASKESGKFATIYQLIEFSIPGIRIVNDSISFSRSNGSALIIVDDIELESTDLSFLLPDNVERIEALTSGNEVVFGPKGANGVLLIYSKNGNGISNEKKTFHTITETINGFYEARTFYVPNYAKPETIEDQFSDIRNTLYWNPNLFLDKTGSAEVTYFNSEVPSTINVTLEGITLEGVPLVVKTNYVIK